MNEKIRQYEDSKKKTNQELEVRIAEMKDAEQARQKKATTEQVQHMVGELESEDFEVKQGLEKAMEAVAKAEVKEDRAEAEYRAKMEAAVSVPELQPESGPPPMKDIVASIIAENKHRAKVAQEQALDFLIPFHSDQQSVATTEAESIRNRTNEEWSHLARQVTGPANALYSEPSQNPYYEDHARTHAIIRPLVMEYVDDKRRRIQNRWKELAEEYVVRKQLYSKKLESSSGSSKDRRSRSFSCDGGSTSIMAGAKARSTGKGYGRGSGGGARGSNPYRRARRGTTASGDIVRSEYEQDQIIAEITAKEAMERRIAHGGSKLPRQICQVEKVFFCEGHLDVKEPVCMPYCPLADNFFFLFVVIPTNCKDLTATFINTFTSYRVFDPLAETEEKQYVINQWSDMEKCIYLDRFLQHPKDFRKIASFLRNKSTKDCIAFYYNSKQSVPYKAALKEHMMRRKRRGDYSVWDATIQAALSVGAVITAGSSDERPLHFSLPNDDHSYFTSKLHPMRREIFDAMEIDAGDFGDESDDGDSKRRKRKFGTLCMLDEAERKFLKRSTSEVSLASMKRTGSSDFDVAFPKTDSLGDMSDANKKSDTPASLKSGPGRKAPQKWTSGEKKLFFDAVDKHGKLIVWIRSVPRYACRLILIVLYALIFLCRQKLETA